MLTFLANVAVTLATKKLFKRPRPMVKDFPKTSKTLFFRNKQSNNSLPSGDTIQAVNLAWFIFRHTGRSDLLAVFVPLAALVAYSRVYLCCHFVSDTVVGALLAVGTQELLAASGLQRVDYSAWLHGLVR